MKRRSDNKFIAFFQNIWCSIFKIPIYHDEVVPNLTMKEFEEWLDLIYKYPKYPKEV